MRSPARVVLVGAHGHGKWHLANIARLGGIATLAGVCDPVPVSDVPWSPDLGSLLDRVDPDVVIIATPIHTHVDLAVTALRAGKPVLLEKPPAPTFTEFVRLGHVVDETGVPLQVGFQSLGSSAVDAMRDLIVSGRLGEVRGIGGAGTWIRTVGYYDRAPWAGHRHLGDGALTNPFAHLVVTALAVAGTGVASIEPELFHAYDIQADDTSAIRIHTTGGVPITLAVTLCASEHRTPYVVVHGSLGSATLYYTEDEIVCGGSRRRYDRVDLLADLIAHPSDVRVPLASSTGFMRVLDAIRRAPDPSPIPPEWIRETGAGPERRREVHGVDDAVLASADLLRTFSEQGVPWARTGR